MTTRIHVGLIGLLVWLAAISTSLAGGPAPGGPGPLRHALRHRGEVLPHRPGEHQCENCRIEMRTMTRVVYEAVAETREKTVYDVITEQQTIHDVKRIPVVQQREVPYTYQRKVVETHFREVPYTTSRPVHEIQTREVPYLTHVPVTETRTVTIPYTVYQTVQEERTRTVYRSVPRQISCTKKVLVPGGRWETCLVDLPDPVAQKGVQKGEPKSVQKPHQVCKRVWVPCLEEREITESRTVYDLKADVVPYTITRKVPVTLTREVPRTYTRMVAVRQVRLESYPVVRMVSEQHVKTVPYTVTRSVPETATRVVSQVTYQEIPTTRVVDVPRQVPRTVCYQVTKMVPRTECIQVPVKICEPVGKAGGAPQKGDVVPQKAEPVLQKGKFRVHVPETEEVTSERVAEGAAQPTAVEAAMAGYFVEG